MKLHSNGFKEEIKLLGKEIDSRITFGNTVLGKENLNAVTPSFQGSLLKSVMKQLDIDSNVEIPVGTVLNYQFGVKINDEYEYINFGNYVVKQVEKQEDTMSYKIICYDKLLYSMIDYTNIGVEYPISIRNYINAICEYLGLTFSNANDEFANYDKMIQEELYLSKDGTSLGYTFRDVLDELAQVTASVICINENDELEVRYINDTKDTIDEEYLKNVNVNFGEKFGAINTIVLSRSANSDNVYYPQELPENPVEFKISDNQIMNGNDRADFLPDIYEKLNGLEFYVNDFSSTGITYYDLYDMYSVKIGDNTYKCLMLNDEILITQGLEENVFTELPEESETDYKHASNDDRKINQAFIIAKKNESEIEVLTSRTSNVEDRVGNVYTIEQTNQLIQNAQTGLTNTFKQSGGNNIFRNTGLWFETNEQDNPYEFWLGKATKQSNYEAVSRSSIILQNGTLEQDEEVGNGTYTVSFTYKKLIELASIKVIINNVEYDLTSLENKEFYTGEKNTNGEYIINPLEVSANHITIKFVSDTDNSLELWDLMVNKGSEKVVWTQNENETTTDTVNISKGITITSSDTDVQFKANADGIRTLDKSGNVLTDFTDKGMTTKEAIIENEATVVGVLRQRVGDQVWDSFIG